MPKKAQDAIRDYMRRDLEGAEMFIKMLALALDDHPGGLPDTELQSIFDRHQSWLSNRQSALERLGLGHLEDDTRKRGE